MHTRQVIRFLISSILPCSIDKSPELSSSFLPLSMMSVRLRADLCFFLLCLTSSAQEQVIPYCGEQSCGFNNADGSHEKKSIGTSI